MAFSDSLLRMMVVAGLSMAGLALLAVPVVAFLKAYGLYRFAQGVATMCIMMLFLGGIQLMAMGLLGAYVGRTYDEAKRRPKFIVDEVAGVRGGSPTPANPAATRATERSRRTDTDVFCGAGAGAILPRRSLGPSSRRILEGVRHRRSRFHRQQPRRPPAWRAATRSSATTTVDRAQGVPAGRARRTRGSARRGRHPRPRRDERRDARAPTSSFTSPPTPTSASAPSTREKDLEQNTIATFNVLEAMRANGIKRIAFSSTGSIYGEPTVFPTPEDAPFPVQTSLYGASKLAGEGLISAYCEGFGFSGCIFRFVSILGERYTHGHVFDFYQRLRADPATLHVLGNGKQRKSYLYVQDCIDAIFAAIGARRRESGASSISAPTSTAR